MRVQFGGGSSGILNRLTSFERGNLSMGGIASNAFGHDYGLDQLNNWPTFNEDDVGDNMDEITQTRSYNDANEISLNDSLVTYVVICHKKHYHASHLFVESLADQGLPQ